MTEIHDTGPITPHEKKVYEKEYKHGADLFQRALKESSKSDNPYQQEQFGEVMDRAMRILNETASELKRSDLMDKNKQIEKDFQSFKDNPTDQAVAALNQDLNKAKKAIG